MEISTFTFYAVQPEASRMRSFIGSSQNIGCCCCCLGPVSNKAKRPGRNNAGPGNWGLIGGGAIA